MTLDLTSDAVKALKRFERPDARIARRIRELVDEASGDGAPTRTERPTDPDPRKKFGEIPYTLKTGKLRVAFVPGRRVLVAGFRKDVCAILPGANPNNRRSGVVRQ